MITKTVNLDSAYQDIFDEIREKSNSALDINNIESYFGNLLEIKALDKKYLRLPVDEPLFEIDANTRKIDVPSEFKSNGLSVQGDHLAETVFFSIDRYFDYTDLSVCDININWKMGQESGKTKNFIMSTNIIPGSIVFGWPINDAITAKSGSLSFAVEFVKKNDNDEIIYAFHTLASNVNIKDGLIIDNAEVVSLEEDILSIITNSQFGEGDAVVGPIQWVTGAGHGLVKGTGADTEVTLRDYSATINLETDIVGGVPASVPANLYAQAFVDAGTEIKYMNSLGNNLEPVMSKAYPLFDAVEDLDNLDPEVTYYDANGDVVEGEDLETAFQLFTLRPLDTNLKYYEKISDNPVAYRLVTDIEGASELYVKLAKLTVSTPGSYFIKAQGQKLDTNGVKIGAGAVTPCDAVVVPNVQMPSAIEIEKSTVNAVDDENGHYSFDPEASANVVFLADNNGTLTANAVVDDFGALQFVWQKKDGSNFVNIANGDVDYKLTNTDTLTVTEAGQYRVKVKNFKNNVYASEVISDVIVASPLAGRITDAAVQYRLGSTAEFVDVSDSGIVDFDSSVQLRQLQLTIAVDNEAINGERGTLEYEWYRNVSAEPEGRQLVGTNQILQASAGDFYYTPVVKNNYNGSIYTFELSPILANDAV